MGLAVDALGRWVIAPDMGFPEQRERMAKVFAHPVLSRGTSVELDTVAGLPVERITARGASSERLVIHWHGGGYTTGTTMQCRNWAAALSAASGATVVLPDYRLAPEHPCPAAIDDAEAVWKALADSPSSSRSRPTGPVLAGDSAGAGLILALAIRLRDSGRDMPPGMIMSSPWLDLTRNWAAETQLARKDRMLRPHWLAASAAAYAGGGDLSEVPLSPLFGDPARLPPALVIAATHDLLVVDSDRWVHKARAAGVEVEYLRAPGLWHDFPMMAGVLAAGDKAAAAAGAFVKRCLGGDGTH